MVLTGGAGALLLVIVAWLIVPSPAAATPVTQVTAEPASPWLKTLRETALWSGSDEQAKDFVKIPADTTVRVVEVAGKRTFVYFGGDGKTIRPGEVWIDSADLKPAAWPRWIRSLRPTSLRMGDAPNAETIPLPRGTWVETFGETSGHRARAFYLGDGRAIGQVEGWIDAADFGLTPTPQERLAVVGLDRATLARSTPEIWLKVPYRSQLDGSRSAEANCGPTTVGMVLEAFGQTLPSGALREAVLDLQGMPGCDDCGVFIEHLASVIESRGLPVWGLRAGDGDYRPWTIEDVRARLKAGQVVIPQVKFRLLPGRGSSQYWGDHYVVITGMIGDRFIYNDPVDSDGSGYGRVISAEALDKAMASSNEPRAAFASGRPEAAHGGTWPGSQILGYRSNYQLSAR
jgi:hypothetical protein